jgi:orotate phosphoribosyltransferase
MKLLTQFSLPHENKSELLHLLKTECYRRGDYKLSSGKKSPHYVNCKPVTLSGYGLSLVSPLMVDLLEDDTEAVAGLTLGADPLVAGVALSAWMVQKPCDAFIVRKKPKGHGTGAWIEGPSKPSGTKVTVLEDVVTTGGSVLKAVDKLREADYTVDRVITIVDRKEYEPDFFEGYALELKSLFTIDDICD